MIKRQTPRKIPEDNPIYFKIPVSGHGELDWRLPFPLYLVRVTEMLREINAGKTKQLDKALDIWIVGGAAIGLCWAHKDYDLETVPSRDLVTYGEAVLNELHESGWQMSDLSVLYTSLIKRIAASLAVTGQEVEDRAGFSEAQKGVTV